MPFGKHVGQKITDVPSSYLGWALQNCSRLTQSFREAIEAELASRHDRQTAPPSSSSSSSPALVLEPVIKKWHSELVMRNHPDRGGSVVVMQALNDAVDRLKKLLKEASL
jgi:hypothetical protein